MIAICVFIHCYFLGKTLLAKAVANQTAATFLRVVGSELIQKYLVRETMTRYIQFTKVSVINNTIIPWCLSFRGMVQN